MKIIGHLLADNFKRYTGGRKRGFEINNAITCDMIENVCKSVMDEYYFFWISKLLLLFIIFKIAISYESNKKEL